MSDTTKRPDMGWSGSGWMDPMPTDPNTVPLPDPSPPARTAAIGSGMNSDGSLTCTLCGREPCVCGQPVPVPARTAELPTEHKIDLAEVVARLRLHGECSRKFLRKHCEEYDDLPQTEPKMADEYVADFIETLAAQVAALTLRLGQSEQRNEALERALAREQKEVFAYQLDVPDYREKIADLTATLAALRAEAEEMQRRLTNAEEERDRFRAAALDIGTKAYVGFDEATRTFELSQMITDELVRLSRLDAVEVVCDKAAKEFRAKIEEVHHEDASRARRRLAGEA